MICLGMVTVAKYIIMTRQLETLFNLDHSDETEPVSYEDESVLPAELITPETLSSMEKIDAALSAVQGLDKTDDELDDLGKLAKDAFSNLLDLGLQVDSRFSAEIFNSAGTMLGHAITAKTAKINKKLKMVDMQLKKAELERKIAAAKKPEEAPDSMPGTGKVIDRNELLRSLIAEASDKNNKKINNT
jgi:hypothetical protein